MALLRDSALISSNVILALVAILGLLQWRSQLNAGKARLRAETQHAAARNLLTAYWKVSWVLIDVLAAIRAALVQPAVSKMEYAPSEVVDEILVELTDSARALTQAYEEADLAEFEAETILPEHIYDPELFGMPGPEQLIFPLELASELVGCCRIKDADARRKSATPIREQLDKLLELGYPCSAIQEAAMQMREALRDYLQIL